MLRRIRALSIGVALLIIGAVSVGTAAWMIYAANKSEVAYQQFAKNSAKADADRAREYEARDCRPLTPQARDKCVSEQEYAAHQAQHDDRDLEAQRTTAVWTRYLGIAGILGTAFGTIGVTLVLLTFMEQRRTSRAELRAYVFAERVVISDGTEKGLREELMHVPSVEVALKNSGNTPARNVRHSGGLMLALSESTDDPPYHPHLEKFSGQTLPPGSEHVHYMMLSDTPLLPPPEGFICLGHADLQALREGRIGMLCYGKIIYEDVFGVEHITEYRFFQTNFWPPIGGKCPMRYAGRGNSDT